MNPSRPRVHGVSYWYRDGRGWYADFRRIGGGRESLSVPAQGAPEEAIQEAIWHRKQEILQGDTHRGRRNPTVASYLDHWLEAQRRNLRPKTIKAYRSRLKAFVKTMPAGMRLGDVGVATLNRYVQARGDQGIAAQTIRAELTSLSSMFRYAKSEGAVRHNPVRDMVSRPRVEPVEAEWLYPGEVARLLDAAKNPVGKHSVHRLEASLFHALVATLFLTGGRRLEVFGLEASDINFDDSLVHFRPNVWRKLKTAGSRRRMPLWPQLAEILEGHVTDYPSGLLFPSPHTGRMLASIQGSLDQAAVQAGIEKRVTPKVARHSYTAARLQTLEDGYPVSVYTVARELGHRGIKKVEGTYGHLQRRRDRADVVEYREAKVVDIGDRRRA